MTYSKGLSASKFAFKWDGQYIMQEAYGNVVILSLDLILKISWPQLMQYG